MRVALPVSVSALLTVGACAPVAPGFGPPHGERAAPHTTTVVYVEAGRATVYPDPAPFVGATNGVIRWTLVLDPSDYIFPDDGVAFSATAPAGKPLPAGCSAVGDPAVRFNLPSCKPNHTRTAYQCTVTGNPHLPKGLCYYYDIRLVRVAGSGPAEIRIDPWAKPN